MSGTLATPPPSSRRASGSADRIERQARARLASVALDLKPSEPAVEALSNGRRRLRGAAVAFHPDRPQFGLCTVGIALGRLRQLTRVLGADFRAHDPATEDDLAFLGAHAAITAGFAARCNATRIRR